jgi:hypothetical protein
LGYTVRKAERRSPVPVPDRDHTGLFPRRTRVSHIVEAKTSIKNPSLELLRRAVETVVARHQGALHPFYLDYYQRRHRVETGLAIFTNELSRGIGVEVDSSGQVTFVGDPYGVGEFYEQVQQETVQSYISLSLMLAMEKMRYAHVQALEGSERHIVVTGASVQGAIHG